jgi:hypothetical protein
LKIGKRGVAILSDGFALRVSFFLQAKCAWRGEPFILKDDLAALECTDAGSTVLIAHGERWLRGITNEQSQKGQRGDFRFLIFDWAGVVSTFDAKGARLALSFGSNADWQEKRDKERGASAEETLSDGHGRAEAGKGREFEGLDEGEKFGKIVARRESGS